MQPVSCTNTHHDVTNFINGMVKNTKTWISWERNITFLWNKKILKLCLILWSYCFVVFQRSVNYEFSGVIGKLGSNHIWRYFLFLHWQKLPLQLRATLLIFFFWSVDYANLVYKLCITFSKCQDTHCLYWSVFTTNINRKIIFNCFLLFKVLLLVSKLYESSH